MVVPKKLRVFAMKLSVNDTNQKRHKNVRDSLGLFSILVILSMSLPSLAGDQFSELRYRFPCNIEMLDSKYQYPPYDPNRIRIEIRYSHLSAPYTVGIDLGPYGLPMVIVNKQGSFEQPFEVVAFEYLSACEQARAILSQGEDQKLIKDHEYTKNLIHRADCQAVSLFQQNFNRSPRAIYQLEEVFKYERAGLEYLGVSYDDRFDNIKMHCPF